jgi:hypothetical protein
MTTKFFYKNLENNINLEKKSLNLFSYYKYYIRNDDNKDVNFLDNNSEIISGETVADEKLAFSSYRKKVNLKHPKYKNITLDILNTKNSQKESKLDNLLNSFIVKDKVKRKELFFLNMVKGGFIVYTNGTVGFVPKTHGAIMLKDVATFLQKKLSKNIRTAFYLQKEFNYKPIRGNFHRMSFSVTPNFKLKKKFQKNKRKNFKNKFFFNYVFLREEILERTKKLKKTLNEYYQNKEKFEQLKGSENIIRKIYNNEQSSNKLFDRSKKFTDNKITGKKLY